MFEKHINKTFLCKYQVTTFINKGSFGSVYIAKNLETNELIALKFERKKEGFRGLLEDEYHKLRYLHNDGIPKAYNFGSTDSHFILAEELLGKNLSELFEMCSRSFSLNTVCLLAIEMINLIQSIHARNHIHRDIKPDNFMIGRSLNEHKLYLIDFGLSRKYWSSSKKEHIPCTKGKRLTGTARYCSVNTHEGYEQSRRDDLVSIGYMMILFLNGVLPWQGLRVKHRNEQLQAIADKKKGTSHKELCKGQPSELVEYFDYVAQLEFEEKPDYAKMVGIMHSVRRKNCNEGDLVYDWEKRIRSGLPMKRPSKREKTEVSNIACRTGGSSYNHTVGGVMTTSSHPEESTIGIKKTPSNLNKKKGRITALANQSTPDFTDEKKKDNHYNKLSVKDIGPELKEINATLKKVPNFDLNDNDNNANANAKTKERQEPQPTILVEQGAISQTQPIINEIPKKKKSNFKQRNIPKYEEPEPCYCICIIF